ncbi:hypothetical protein X474_12060 [Dethiosulfatarculus sandiegensis]|uniref:Uncharacterized protein n=1 Tax=Dethiosulfatarculus sandiegensis TaxID=1429043 RepID=A0A0D2JWE9_9BACT|nr:hypothetical protein X474_12060 [Dethiosulfatarculus sandiegensis]
MVFSGRLVVKKGTHYSIYYSIWDKNRWILSSLKIMVLTVSFKMIICLFLDVVLVQSEFLFRPGGALDRMRFFLRSRQFDRIIFNFSLLIE